MTIPTITRTNTIDEWRVQTNQSATELNTLETGDYEKANGTLTLSGNSSLSITANGTSLQVSNNALFQSDVVVEKDISVGVRSAQTGNVTIGNKLTVYGVGFGLEVSNNALVNTDLQVTRTIYTGNISANGNLTVGENVTIDGIVRLDGTENVLYINTGSAYVNTATITDLTSTNTDITNATIVDAYITSLESNDLLSTTGNIITFESQTSDILNATITNSSLTNTAIANAIVESAIVDYSETNLLSVSTAKLNIVSVNTSATVGTTLSVTGNTNVGNLVTTGHINSGSLRTSGVANVGSGMTVAGDAILSSKLNVTGNTTTTNIVNSGHINSGSLRTSGVANVGSGMTVAGNTTTTNIVNSEHIQTTSLRTSGNANVGSGMTVTGNTTTTNIVNSGHINTGSLRTSGNANVGSGMTVAGDTILSSKLNVTGNTTTTNIVNSEHIQTTSLRTSGNANVGSGMTVAGDTILSSKLNVTGNTTTSNIVNSEHIQTSTLRTTGVANVGSGMTVAGDAILSSKLNVTGNTTTTNIVNSQHIQTSTLRTSGNANVGSGLTVTGNTTTSNIVNSEHIQTSTLRTSGVANVGSGMTVAGDAILSSKLNVTGNTTTTNIVNSQHIQTTSLRTSGNANVGSGLTVTGNTTTTNIVNSGHINTGTLRTTGRVDIGGVLSAGPTIVNSLSVENNLNVSGDIVIEGTTLIDSDILTLRSTAIEPVLGNSFIGVNRGEAANAQNANSYIRWNESNKYWDLRDVNNPTSYSKILTANLISDSTNSTSSSTIASSNSVKTVSDSVVTANTNLKAYVDGKDTNLQYAVDGANAAIVTANTDLKAYTDGKFVSTNAYVAFANTSLKSYVDSTFFTKSGGTISGATTITGNLTVTGTTTFINTDQLNVGDNIITLNADLPITSSPSQNAGIEVNRGTSSNTFVIWNESSDRWTFTNNGTNYYNIPVPSEYDNYGSWTAEDGDGTRYTVTSLDILKYNEGAGIDIDFTGDDILTFTNTDRGSSQNIFKNFTITDTNSGYTWAETGTVVADNNDDTVTFVSGGAIDIDVDATNDAILINHADTSSVTNLTASGRRYVTGLTFDTYGHVTGYTTGTETVVDTTYSISTEVGADAYSEKIRLTGSDASIDDIILAVGPVGTTYGLTIEESGDTITFKHADTSSQGSVNNSGTTYIQDITLDEYGHITAIGSSTLPTYDNYVSWTAQDGDTTTYTITSGDTLQFAEGTGMDVNFTSDDVLTFTNTDRGSSQNIFKNFAVTDADTGYTWAATGTVVADNNNDTVTFVSGGGINIDANTTLDAIRISHADTSSVTNLTASGRRYVTGLTFDTYGHVTGYTTGTETVVDTNTTYSVSTEPGTGDYQEIIRLTGSDSSQDDVILAVGPVGTTYGLTIEETGDTITFKHADTSSQGSVNNSGTTYIQDITLDEYGHITAIGSSTLPTYDNYRYFVLEDGDGTEVQIDSLNEIKFVEGSGTGATIDINWTDTSTGSDADPYDLTFTVTNTDRGSSQNIFKNFVVTDTNTGYTWTETGTVVADSNDDTVTFVSGGGINVDVDASLDAIKISHRDTSSQASVNNSNGNVIQDITLDTYGHITAIGSVNLDSRYFTETESDARFLGINANAASASKWNTSRTLTLGGDLTGSVAFDGSANFTLSAQVTNDSHTHAFNNLTDKASGTGIYQTSGSFRAPIFYDSDNTAYYMDPNQTSRFNVIRVGSTTASYIEMEDDNSVNGKKHIHANDDNIGFLGGTGSWIFRVDASGNAVATGDVIAYSDERLKTDWKELNSNFIEELASVKSGTYTRIDNNERRVGVSAQDIQKIVPEAVTEDKEGYLSLAYGNAALVAAVELSKEVLSLRKEIEELKQMIGNK